MGIREKLEKIMMAISFSEANDHETARKILREEERPRRSKRPSSRPRPRNELHSPSARR